MSLTILGIDPGPSWTAIAVVRVHSDLWREWTAARYVETKDVTKHVERAQDDLGPLVIALEVVRGFIFAPYRGPHVIATSEVVGGLKNDFASRGWTFVEITAGQWRKQLCDRANADKKLIAQRLAIFFMNQPKKSNEHTRDAAGAALAVGLRLKRQGVRMRADGKLVKIGGRP